MHSITLRQNPLQLNAGLVNTPSPKEDALNIVDLNSEDDIRQTSFSPIALTKFILGKIRTVPVLFAGNFTVPLKHYFKSLSTKGESSPRRMKCPEIPKTMTHIQFCALKIASTRSSMRWSLPVVKYYRYIALKHCPRSRFHKHFSGYSLSAFGACQITPKPKHQFYECPSKPSWPTTVSKQEPL